MDYRKYKESRDLSWRVLLDEAERKGMGMVLVSHSPALTARVATRTVEL